MSRWPSTQASRVLAALLRIGWSIKRTTGFHKVLERDGCEDVIFSFHDRVEIGVQKDCAKVPVRKSIFALQKNFKKPCIYRKKRLAQLLYVTRGLIRLNWQDLAAL